MNSVTNDIRKQSVPRVLSFPRIAFAALLTVSSISAQAGLITSNPATATTQGGDGVQLGFGGWNLDNVEVVLNGTQGAIGSADSWFDPATGEYNFAANTDFTYSTNVDDGLGTIIMGHVLAKDWPVGEPAGIKIVNDDFDVKSGKATNCIMSTSYLEDHFLDTADPMTVLCSGPFQSHKRYKLAMLPTTVDGVGEEGIDLEFNVTVDGTSRDYQVFQKINNWTDERLEGFTIQVGTGVGANFVLASDGAGVGVDKLSLSVPSTVWPATQLANFSTGLFGPIDLKHGRPEGYFDPAIRAGFKIVEYGVGNPGDLPGQTDTLTSGDTLGSSYADVPAGALAAANQFGNWLPNTMLPYGIFFDDDADPDTDNQLVAWYGYSVAAGSLQWMKGAADDFELVSPVTITDIWSNDPLYSMGVIDDLVNVGLNYVVTVGDVSGFPGSKFTIRITPKTETVPTAAPTYVGVVPNPSLSYTSSDATIELTPSQFAPGATLTVRVADADLNTTAGIDTTTVDVSTTDGSVSGVSLTLNEVGVERGIFSADLPAAFSNILAGETVTVTYTDVSGGAIPNEVITDTSTALNVHGTIQFQADSYVADENDGTVDLTVTRTGLTDGEVTVAFQTISGTAKGGWDYVAESETIVTFADGDAVPKTITIDLINDTAAEPSETFSVLLSGLTGGADLGATSTATVTITDTDTEPYGTIQFVPATYSLEEGAGTVELTVTRDATGGAVTIDYQTIDGTAVAGSDFVAVAAPTTLAFADGEASKTITIALIDDAVIEPTETFTLVLSNEEGGVTLGAADTATVTITDTGSAGTIQFDPAAYTVDETSGTVNLTVTRTGGVDGVVTVDYQTADGTAVAGSDYVAAASTTITFASGDAASQTISVALIDDSTVEFVERFTVGLSNPTGGALGTATTATVTVTDYDRSPSRSGGSLDLFSLGLLGLLVLVARRKL